MHAFDDDHLIVEPILSEICWKEYDSNRRKFDYENLTRVIKFIKTGKARHIQGGYSESVTYALKELHVPEYQWTVIRAIASLYFKAVKSPNELDDKYWEVEVLEKTREIFLYHPSTMSRSESLYHNRGFELGSVSVEGRPCRLKRVVELHRRKCSEVAYRTLSGR
jgi:hypothetical protein